MMLFKILREGRTAYVHSYWLVEIVEGWVLGSDAYLQFDSCWCLSRKKAEGRARERGEKEDWRGSEHTVKHRVCEEIEDSGSERERQKGRKKRKRKKEWET